VVVAILGVAHAGKADHLIGFPAVAVHQIAEGDHPIRPQALTHRLRLYEAEKNRTVRLGDIGLGIVCQAAQEGEMLAGMKAVVQLGMDLVADPLVLVLVQLDIIDAVIV